MRSLFGRALVAAAFAAVLASPPAFATSLPAGFEERSIAWGLGQPVAAAWLPDGRMLVAEKPGRVRRIQADGAAEPTPWIDIRDRVNSYSDRGLLGIAVDSQFVTNPYVYLLYVHDNDAIDDDGPHTSRLSRFRVTNGVPGPEEVILGGEGALACPAPDNDADCIPADGTSHAIGTVHSAPDGTLFVGSGDGGFYTHVDPISLRARDERSLAGKIMRVDRNGRGLADRPFCPGETDLTKVCTKVYAKGFRNPFRFSLRDGRGPAVADVGLASKEEVDLVQPGRDYGWPCWEGSIQTPVYKELDGCKSALSGDLAGARTPPAYEYDHGPEGASIIGGAVYTGTEYPAKYRGAMFVGDYVKGTITSLTTSGDTVTASEAFATGWTGGVQLTTAPNGNVTYVDLMHNRIMQWRYTGANRPPVAAAKATPTNGTTPLTVAFDASGSTDPDGDPMTYSWTFGDGATATGAKPSHTYTAIGTHTAEVTVSDGKGNSAKASVTVTAGNSAPQARITSPAAGSLVTAGTQVALTGSGVDVQNEPVTLSWDIDLVHNQHTHKLTALSGPSASFLAQRDHDADSYYVVTLTATDASGLSSKDTVTLRQRSVQMTLASDPPGVPLGFSSVDHVAPTTLTTAVGFQPTVSAPETAIVGGQSYRFDRWSDGGARVHQITVPEAAFTLTAHYVKETAPPPGTMRLNLGGPAETVGGVAWTACPAATNCGGASVLAGGPYSTTSPVTGVLPPASAAIYASGWQGSSAVAAGTRTVGFDLWVPNGRYRVRLHFTSAAAAGQRVFDVDLDMGARELSSFDAFAAAGGAGRAVVRELLVTLGDGKLDVDLYHRAGGAQLNAIEVLPDTAPVPDTTPPGPVTAFTAGAGDARAELRWTNPATDFAATRVLRSTAGYASSPVAGGAQLQVYEGTGSAAAVTGLPNGTRQYFTAFARDAAGNWSVAAQATATPVAPSGPPVDASRPTVRFNAGGAAVTAGSTTWAACASNVGCNGGRVDVYGGVARTAAPLPTVTGASAPAVPELFRTAWTGGASTGVPVGARAFGYDVFVPNGAYRVRLHFAETAGAAAGARIFDVNVDMGPVELAGLDVAAQAGGAGKAIVRELDLTLVDGKLDIDLIRRAGDAIVQAVEVIPITTVAPQQPASLSVQTTAQAEVTGQLALGSGAGLEGRTVLVEHRGAETEPFRTVAATRTASRGTYRVSRKKLRRARRGGDVRVRFPGDRRARPVTSRVKRLPSRRSSRSRRAPGAGA